MEFIVMKYFQHLLKSGERRYAYLRWRRHGSGQDYSGMGELVSFWRRKADIAMSIVFNAESKGAVCWVSCLRRFAVIEFYRSRSLCQ